VLIETFVLEKTKRIESILEWRSRDWNDGSKEDVGKLVEMKFINIL
jgi:hypothetical protein